MNTHNISGQVNIDDFVIGREIPGVTRDGSGKDYIILHRHQSSDTHPTRSSEHYVLGTITGVRGSTGSYNRKLNIEINSTTAYDTTHINAVNKGFPDNTLCRVCQVTYSSVIYTAIEIPTGSTLNTFRFTGRLFNSSGDKFLSIVHGDDTSLSNITRMTPSAIDFPGAVNMRGLDILNQDDVKTISFDGGASGEGGSQSMKNASGQETFSLLSGNAGQGSTQSLKNASGQETFSLLSGNAGQGSTQSLKNASGQETFNLSSGGSNGESTLALKNTAGQNTVALTGGTSNGGGGLSVKNSAGADTFNVDGGDSGGTASTSIQGSLGLKNASGQETMSLDGGGAGAGATQSMKNASGQETYNLSSGGTSGGSSQTFKNSSGVTTVETTGGTSSTTAGTSYRNDAGIETLSLTVVDGGGGLSVMDSEGNSTVSMDGESGSMDVTGTAAISNAEITQSTTETMFVTDKVEMLAGTNQLGGEFSPTGAAPTTPHLHFYDKYSGTFFVSDVVGVMSRSQDGVTWSTCRADGITSANIIMEMTSVLTSNGKTRLLAFINQNFSSGVARTVRSDDLGDTWVAHGSLVMESTYYAGGSVSRNRTLYGGSSNDVITRDHFLAGVSGYGFSPSTVRGSYPFYEDYIGNTTNKNYLKNFFISSYIRAASQEIDGDNYPIRRNLNLTAAELDFIYMPEGDWWHTSTREANNYAYSITMYHIYWNACLYHHKADFFVGAGGSYPGSSNSAMMISGLRHMMNHKNAGGTINQSFVNSCPVRLFFVCNTSGPLYNSNAGWAFSITSAASTSGLRDSIHSSYGWMPYRSTYILPWSTVRTTAGINSIANGGWGLQHYNLAYAWEKNGVVGQWGEEGVKQIGSGQIIVDPSDSESWLMFNSSGVHKLDTRALTAQHNVQHTGVNNTTITGYGDPTMSVTMNRYFSENELTGYLAVTTAPRSTLLTNNSTLGQRNSASRYIRGNTAGTTVTLTLDNTSATTNASYGSYPTQGDTVSFYKLAIWEKINSADVAGVPVDVYKPSVGNVSEEHVNSASVYMIADGVNNDPIISIVGQNGTASSANYRKPSYTKIGDVWSNTFGNGLKVPSFLAIFSNSIGKHEIATFPTKYNISSSPHLALIPGEEWVRGSSYLSRIENIQGNVQSYDSRHSLDQANNPLEAYGTMGNTTLYHHPFRSGYTKTTNIHPGKSGGIGTYAVGSYDFYQNGSTADVHGWSVIHPGFYYNEYIPAYQWPQYSNNGHYFQSTQSRNHVGAIHRWVSANYAHVVSILEYGTPDTYSTDERKPTCKRFVGMMLNGGSRNPGWFWLTHTNYSYNKTGHNTSSSHHVPSTYGYDPSGSGNGSIVYSQQIPGGGTAGIGSSINSTHWLKQASQVYSSSKLMGRWHPEATKYSYDGISYRNGEEVMVITFWDSTGHFDKNDWNVALYQSQHSGGETGYYNTSNNTSTDHLCDITTVYSDTQWSTSYGNQANCMHVVLKKSTTFGGKGLVQFMQDNGTRPGVSDNNVNHSGTEYVFLVKITLKSNANCHFHQSFVARTGTAWPDEPNTWQLGVDDASIHNKADLRTYEPFNQRYNKKIPLPNGSQIVYTNYGMHPVTSWVSWISHATMNGLNGSSISNANTYVSNYQSDLITHHKTTLENRNLGRGSSAPGSSDPLVFPGDVLCYLPNNGGALATGIYPLQTGHWPDDLLWVYANSSAIYTRKFTGPTGGGIGNQATAQFRPIQDNNKLYVMASGKIFFCEIPTLSQMLAVYDYQPEWTEITPAMTGLFSPVGILYAHSIGKYVIAGEGGNYVTSIDGETIWESKIKPQFSFASKPDTGLFKDTNHDLHLTHNGQNKLTVDIDGVNINAQPLTVNSLLRKKYQSQTYTYPNLTYDNTWRNLGTAEWNSAEIPNANGGGVIIWHIIWHITATSTKYMTAYTRIAYDGSIQNTTFIAGEVMTFNIRVVFDNNLGKYIIQYMGYDYQNGTNTTGNLSWEIRDQRPQCVITP